MNAYDAFEQRKDALLEEIQSAKETGRVLQAVTMALEQTACELAQDEQDEHARQRQQAVMSLAKRAPSLLRAAQAKGEMRLHRSRAVKPRYIRPLQIAGALILLGLAVVQLISGGVIYAILQIVGALLLGFGAVQSISAADEDVEAVGVIDWDADQLVRSLGELCQGVDICVSDLALIESDEGVMHVSGTVDEATIDLLVSLMEARATGREDIAMRSLAQAEQYLRALGVEVVYYRKDCAEFFDVLPTISQERTVRPALLRDGQLIRRGVAACVMERSVGA